MFFPSQNMGAEKAPVVILLIDKSESMSSRKTELLSSAQSIISNIPNNSFIALTNFSTFGEILDLREIQVPADRQALLERIKNIKFSGRTNPDEGAKIAALALAKLDPLSTHRSFVFCITDGWTYPSNEKSIFSFDQLGQQLTKDGQVKIFLVDLSNLDRIIFKKDGILKIPSRTLSETLDQLFSTENIDKSSVELTQQKVYKKYFYNIPPWIFYFIIGFVLFGITIIVYRKFNRSHIEKYSNSDINELKKERFKKLYTGTWIVQYMEKNGKTKVIQEKEFYLKPGIHVRIGSTELDDFQIVGVMSVIHFKLDEDYKPNIYNLGPKKILIGNNKIPCRKSHEIGSVAEIVFPNLSKGLLMLRKSYRRESYE